MYLDEWTFEWSTPTSDKVKQLQKQNYDLAERVEEAEKQAELSTAAIAYVLEFVESLQGVDRDARRKLTALRANTKPAKEILDRLNKAEAEREELFVLYQEAIKENWDTKNKLNSVRDEFHDEICDRCDKSDLVIHTISVNDIIRYYTPSKGSWYLEGVDIDTRECCCCGQPGHYQKQIEEKFASDGPWWDLSDVPVLGSSGFVYDGHHRILAAHRLGIKSIVVNLMGATYKDEYKEDNLPCWWDERLEQRNNQ